MKVKSICRARMIRVFTDHCNTAFCSHFHSLLACFLLDSSSEKFNQRSKCRRRAQWYCRVLQQRVPGRSMEGWARKRLQARRYTEVRELPQCGIGMEGLPGVSGDHHEHLFPSFRLVSTFTFNLVSRLLAASLPRAIPCATAATAQ